MNRASRTSLVLMVCVIFLLTCSGASFLGAAERIVVNDDLEIEPAGNNLWRHISYFHLNDFGRTPANGLIVVSDGQAVIIDTPWTDEQTLLLFGWISKHLSAKVVSVIGTHWHGDCLGGLSAAHERGVASYAHEQTRAFARLAGRPVPRTGFKDSLDLNVGARKIQLRYLGPGHTSDNIVVWIPDARVLFGGCLVKSAQSRTLGFTGEADLDNWPATIQRLLEEYGNARLFIPGHGQPGGRELPERTLELLRDRK